MFQIRFQVMFIYLLHLLFILESQILGAHGIIFGNP